MKREAGSVTPAATEGDAEKLAAELVGELLGLLAHDLRNPLAALHSNLGYLDSVLAGKDEEAREAVEDGVVSCDGLSHVIDNVDLFGQVLREGPGSMKLSPSPIVTIVASAVERCQAAARSHGSRLELDPESRRVHATVRTARDYAVRALANLLRNSIQHAPSGSLVEVKIEQGPDAVVVRVLDSGMSVAECAQKAFSATGQIQAKSQPGNRYSRGMGLYCARLAASLCGAQLEAPSSGHEGNEFRLVFPAQG